MLKGIGNSKEYAMSYPGTYSLYEVKQMCYWVVPDGFDAPKPTVNILDMIAA